MQGPYFAIPGETNSHQFVLYLADGTALQPSATLAAGDFIVWRDGSSDGNADNLPQNRGNGVYAWTQTAAEATAGSKVTLACDDQTATETFLGTALNVFVYELDEVASKFYSGPFGPGVFYDSVNGAAGTTLGTNGTESNPCSTWANALAVGAKLGIDRYYVTGGSTATLTGSVADYNIIGLGAFDDNTVALASQNCDSTRFRNIEITGTQAGTVRAQFDSCLLNGVTSLHCEAKKCGLTGNLTMSSNDDHIFDECFSMVPGGGTVTMTLAANVDVGVRHHSGGWTLASGGATNGITLEGDGQFIVDGTCTNLNVNYRGSWRITDNGTGTTLVGPSGDAAVFGYEDAAIWYDSGAASTGTVIGVDGTADNPCNTFADAVSLAGSTNLSKINCLSAATLAGAPGAIEIVGVGTTRTITCGSQNLIATRFVNCTLTGDIAAASGVRVVDGRLSSLTDFGGEAIRCAMSNTVSFQGPTQLIRVWSENPASGNPAVLDMTTAGSELVIRDGSGEFQISNLGATSGDVDIEGSGNVVIDATCTDRTVTLRGDFEYTNDSAGGGTTVVVAGVSGVDVLSFGGDTSVIPKLNAQFGIVEKVTITSASTSTSLIASGLTATTDDIYIDRVGIFTTGALKGRGFTVVDYVGATKTLTVDQLPAAPALTDEFLLEA